MTLVDEGDTVVLHTQNYHAHCTKTLEHSPETGKEHTVYPPMFLSSSDCAGTKQWCDVDAMVILVKLICMIALCLSFPGP